MSLFSFFKRQDETGNPTKHKREAPATVDWTNSLQANSTLTKGLYHNSYPGMKLGGALAYTPIAVPISFMGAPIPHVEDEESPAAEVLKQIVEDMLSEFKNIHRQSHREGTIWVFPMMSGGKLIWEFIPDESVTDIVRDLSSGEIITLEVEEDITLATGSGNTDTITRKRTFSQSRVTIQYSKAVPSSVSTGAFRNPAGMIPIPFSNNSDGDEIRGHSDYERILSDLKSYHDIELSEQTILAKFSPKMVISKLKDVNTFAQQNGYADGTDLIENMNIATIDLLLAQDEESIEFEFPERVTTAYQTKLKQIFRKIVEGSGIPEIAWGLKSEGNMASVEESVSFLMDYVADKQDQKTEAYRALFEASLRLYVAAGLLGSASDVKIEWNKLDSLSDKTKSDIMKNFADALSVLAGKAMITMEQAFKLWQENFPGVTGDDFEAFRRGLADMAGHTVATNANLSDYMLNNSGMET